MIDDENKRYLLKKRFEIINECPLCHGTKPYCKCAYDFRVEINKASSNIPIAYRDFSLDKLTHPQLTQQKKDIEEFLTTVGTGEQRDLLITGGPGLAKSAVACLILIKLLQQNKKAYYFPSLRAVMDACLSNYRGESPTETFEKFEAAHTIVIDGLGYGFIRDRSNGTDIVLEHLERRRLLGKHVVFVSSVERCDLAGGERTLIDLLNPYVINFKGFNYISEVLEKVDKENAKRVTKLSTKSVAETKKQKINTVKEDNTFMSPYEIALKQQEELKAKEKEEKRKARAKAKKGSRGK